MKNIYIKNLFLEILKWKKKVVFSIVFFRFYNIIYIVILKEKHHSVKNENEEKKDE